VHTDIRCLCGFAELEDESLADHLHVVFIADETLASDGQAHEETSTLNCSCGFTAASSDDLDAHFLKAFTPESAIGRDGNKHLIA